MFEKLKDAMASAFTSKPGKGGTFQELGVAGAKISNGYVYDEFLRQLQLDRGRRTFREMGDNDATTSSILFAVEMVLRAVDWTIEENSETIGTKESEDAAEWTEGVLFKDMSHTWDEFIAEVLSMIRFGWEYTEIVYKRREGPDHTDPKKRSIYDDDTIGIRKLANRAQETLDHWDIDEQGGVNGLWQLPPMGGQLRYIPIEKALHFKPHPTKGSPEGRSALRGAYRSWEFLKTFQELEAIAIERELNGLPVVYIPSEILNGDSAEAIAAKNAYVAMVRDIKLNAQGGAVLPSDTYFGEDGKRTNIKQVELKLLASEGSRSINVGEVILRYQRDIARTILADFVMLGSGDSGSWALSKDKSDLFVRALEGWNSSIASVINRYLIPRLWRLNGFKPEVMPKAKPGKVSAIDLDELGKFISDMAKSGAPLFPDEDLENHLREVADLPEKDIDNYNEDDITVGHSKPEETVVTSEEIDQA
jgi:hypothetical protein